MAGFDLPAIGAERLQAVTADQMREIDRITIEELGIDLARMMENAGRGLSDLVLRLFGPSTVTVLAGAGGNGGGGLVAARHLTNRGAAVSVTLSAPRDELAPVTGHQLDILERMGVAIVAEPPAADVVVDALIGYGLRGDPTGPAAALIEWANEQPASVVSLDAPSGLDVTTGMAGHPTVRACVTMTLALPKAGLLGAWEQVGRLYLADISVPQVVYERMGLAVENVFAAGAIVEVRS